MAKNAFSELKPVELRSTVTRAICFTDENGQREVLKGLGIFVTDLTGDAFELYNDPKPTQHHVKPISHVIRPGDYVVVDPKGDWTCLKPDDFRELYKVAGNKEAATAQTGGNQQ